MESEYIAQINTPAGIEMRASMQIVECAQDLFLKYYKKIELRLKRYDGEFFSGEADATSVMEVPMLALLYKDKVKVIVRGNAESGEVKSSDLEDCAKTLKDKLEEDLKK